MNLLPESFQLSGSRFVNHLFLCLELETRFRGLSEDIVDFE